MPGPQILLYGLNGRVPKEQLDLFQARRGAARYNFAQSAHGGYYLPKPDGSGMFGTVRANPMNPHPKSQKQAGAFWKAGW